MSAEQGFSLVEIVVATSVMLAATASVFVLTNPAQGIFAAQIEVADVQQRLRVAGDTLFKDLVNGGTILPLRRGAIDSDPPDTFRSDIVTVVAGVGANNMVVSHTYYLNKTTWQLMHYDGTTGPDVPVVDHVVGLRFDYFGDPQPPQLTGDMAGGPTGPWTTYGPMPPPLASQIPNRGYPAGENCVFVVSSGIQVPRLPVLGPGGSTTTLVKLTSSQLTDGPWCPDQASADRFDADLYRIRKIAVTVRVEAANQAMRGPASFLFTNGGTSTSGSRWVPDEQIAFEVAPRNLNLGR